MVKILFVHHSTGWGGAPINMINIINSLDKNLFSAHVLLLKDSVVSKKLNESKIPYTIVTSKFYKKYYKYLIHSEAGYIRWYQIVRFFKLFIFWLLSNRIYAKKELDQFKPDVIHLNSSVLIDWLRPCSKKGKVILHVQEPFRKGKFDLLYHFLRWQISKYADSVVAISEDNAIRLNLLNKTKVIYNYCELPNSNPSEFSYKSKKVLYVGGSASIKGFLTIAEAVNYLDSDIHLYFAGHYGYIPLIKMNYLSIKHFIKYVFFSEYRKRIQMMIRLNRTQNVTIVGLTNSINELVNEVCCLVSPFTVPHFSRPVIEAHMQSKPVVVTNVAGIGEIVNHGVTGLIVPVNNPWKLADAISYLCNNPSIAQNMGEAGYKAAIESFSPINIEQFAKIYQSL